MTGEYHVGGRFRRSPRRPWHKRRFGSPIDLPPGRFDSEPLPIVSLLAEDVQQDRRPGHRLERARRQRDPQILAGFRPQPECSSVAWISPWPTAGLEEEVGSEWGRADPSRLISRGSFALRPGLNQRFSVEFLVIGQMLLGTIPLIAPSQSTTAQLNKLLPTGMGATTTTNCGLPAVARAICRTPRMPACKSATAQKGRRRCSP